MRLPLFLLASALACAQPKTSRVVNAANGSPFVAPGSLISIFGTGLSSGTASAVSAWPTSLGGSSVIVCESPTQCVPAGLLYVSPTQINAYTPLAVTSLSVTTGGMTSPPMLVLSSLAAPGIFPEGTDIPYDAGWKAWSACALDYTLPGLTQPLRGAITDRYGKVVRSSNPARPRGVVYDLDHRTRDWIILSGTLPGITNRSLRPSRFMGSQAPPAKSWRRPLWATRNSFLA